MRADKPIAVRSRPRRRRAKSMTMIRRPDPQDREEPEIIRSRGDHGPIRRGFRFGHLLDPQHHPPLHQEVDRIESEGQGEAEERPALDPAADEEPTASAVGRGFEHESAPVCQHQGPARIDPKNLELDHALFPGQPDGVAGLQLLPFRPDLVRVADRSGVEDIFQERVAVESSPALADLDQPFPGFVRRGVDRQSEGMLRDRRLSELVAGEGCHLFALGRPPAVGPGIDEDPPDDGGDHDQKEQPADSAQNPSPCGFFIRHPAPPCAIHYNKKPGSSISRSRCPPAAGLSIVPERQFPSIEENAGQDESRLFSKET